MSPSKFIVLGEEKFGRNPYTRATSRSLYQVFYCECAALLWELKTPLVDYLIASGDVPDTWKIYSPM